MTDFLSMTAEQVERLPEAAVGEVLDAWVKAKRIELPQALTQSPSKGHAKLAKKALYRLHSTGVRVAPAAMQKSAPIQPSAEETKNDLPAVLSMQLGTGERAFLFAVPIRGGGIEAFQGVIHDEFGLAELSTERANRSLYRKRVKELQRDPGARVILVSAERMFLELGKALTLNQKSASSLAPPVLETLERLGVRPQPPEFDIPPLEPGDDSNREAGASLHQTFEIAQWFPSEQHLVALSARIKPQEEESNRQAAHALAAEAFTPAVRSLYARRLWFTAELFDFQGRSALAADARAEARRLAHESSPSRFAQALFEKATTRSAKL